MPRWGRALPGLLVASPLVAFSFQGDERRNIYYNAERFGTNPLEPAGQAIDEIPVFLRLGNFRPLGRFLDYTEHTFVFEAAEATGIAPHVVHGFVRMAMVAVLALVCIRLIHQFLGTDGADAPWFVPAVVGVSLVAGGPESPITHFPFLFMFSATATLLIPQLTVRRDDLRRGDPSGAALAFLFGVGAASAMTFDLVYIAPPLTVIYLGAQAFRTGQPISAVLRSAAAKRTLALCLGFVLVFVPVRFVIANECSSRACYSGSDLNASSRVLPLTIDRIVTAAPASGWDYNSRIVGEAATSFGLRDLLANTLFAITVAALAAAVARTAWRGRRRPADNGVLDNDASSREVGGLLVVGAGTIVLAAVLVSLAPLVQRGDFAIGQAWRDTLLAQMGWAMAISALLTAGLRHVERVPKADRVAAAGLALALIGALSLTLLANARLAHVDRRDVLASLSNQISTATVDFDLTGAGDDHRCTLIDRYTELEPNPSAWTGGPQLRANLDQLALARHGRPFCEPGDNTSP
jgi:hypothetical protein